LLGLQTMSEYTVLLSISIQDLIEEVNSFIKEGWQPLGGIVVDSGKQCDMFLQTMIK